MDGAFDMSQFGGGSEGSDIVSTDSKQAYQIHDPFTRFDVYAPHVKHLDVYGPKGVMFEVTGWRVLIARTRRQLLLPNLHTMTILTTCNSSGSCQPMWIGAFSSPSLVNLLIMASNRSNPPTVSYHAASFIMRSFTSHRPKIEKLGLFPDSSDGEHAEDGESSLLAFLSGDKFYEYASNLTSLRHLTGTFAWFKVPALQILGQLPHLESITVYGADDADYVGSELTEDLFPALQSLTLHRSNCFNTLETLGATQVIKNLTLLHVTLDICAEELDTDDNTWLVEEFFPLLLNTPRLADLKINAHANYVRDDSFVIGESVLRIFQGLPGLKRLHLDEVYLSDEALQFDLASAWPSVTHLKLPGRAASLASLSRFASLPELCHLELQVELYDPTREYDTTLSSLMTLEASFGSAICSKFEEMDRVLHALLNIFPELTRVVWADDPLSRLADQHTIERAGFLNGYLATLRELRALKKLPAM